MNTAELFQRMLRPLEATSISDLTANEAVEFLDAYNSGVQEFYQDAPDHYRRRILSFYLKAPQTIAVEVVNGSKEIGGVSPLNLTDVHKTIRIQSDSGWNRVADINALLDAYLGETGTKSAYLYSDALTLEGFEVERLCAHPRLNTGFSMVRDETLREYNEIERHIGQPWRYWLAQNAPFSSEASGATGFIVIDPIPDKDYLLRVEAVLRPSRYRLSVFQTPAPVQVPDSYIEAGFLPLVMQRLLLSGLFNRQLDPRVIYQQAADAKSFIQRLPEYIGVPSNKEGTPYGW